MRYLMQPFLQTHIHVRIFTNPPPPRVKQNQQQNRCHELDEVHAVNEKALALAPHLLSVQVYILCV